MGRSLPLLGVTDAGLVTERKDAARNRQKILAAARTLLQKGDADICMDALAHQAGVGKGTLYRRFADKHALFRALLDDDERVLQDATRARFGLAKDKDPTAYLCALWGALVDFVIDHKDVLAIAEGEVRARASLHESAPYHWRHIELSRALSTCGVPKARAELTASAWLQTLNACLLRAACERAPVDDVRAAWRALPGGLGALRDV